jgi:DeoR/GlpR family transcriptional regulator of sugar metabolism
VLAFLTDGESWSSSALALALGGSQRTVQRALDSLTAEGKVQSFGRARAPLDNSARAGIHDDIVTPRAAANWLRWKHESIKSRNRPGIRSLLRS